MKTYTKLLTPFLAALITLCVLTPQNVEARGRCHKSGYTYVSGHTSCGCPVYTKRVVKYYDCRGYPVYAYYRQPVSHRCRTHYAPRSCSKKGSYSYGYTGHRPSYKNGYRRCGTRSGISVTYRSSW